MNKNQKLIDSMREYADFLERADHLNELYSGELYTPLLVFSVDELKRQAAGCGQLTKESSDDFFRLTRRFGPLKFAIVIEREKVCKRIVEKVTLPATEEVVIPAKPELVVDKIRWECPESVLAPEVLVEVEIDEPVEYPQPIPADKRMELGVDF